MNAPADKNNRLLMLCLGASILIGAFLSLTACSVPTTVSMTNFSSDNINVLFQVDNDSQINVTLNKNMEIKINGLLDKHFIVRSKNRNFYYGVKTVPEEFINNSWVGPFFKRIVKVQFEDDKCIYLVAINDSASRARMTVQPQGFPLCPNTNNPSKIN